MDEIYRYLRVPISHNSFGCLWLKKKKMLFGKGSNIFTVEHSSAAPPTYIACREPFPLPPSNQSQRTDCRTARFRTAGKKRAAADHGKSNVGFYSRVTTEFSNKSISTSFNKVNKPIDKQYETLEVIGTADFCESNFREVEKLMFFC